tara:strand:- start:1210 stop:1560 length:351 start_codon:yes stop_codon:yes gene_type:complete
VNKPIVDREVIKNLLYGDDDYLDEFVQVSIISFTEFKENFDKHLSNRDLASLRTTGHKVKPVAQMMNLHGLLELYEKSKLVIQDNLSDEELNTVLEKMDAYCEILLKELENLIEAP